MTRKGKASRRQWRKITDWTEGGRHRCTHLCEDCGKCEFLFWLGFMEEYK